MINAVKVVASIFALILLWIPMAHAEPQPIPGPGANIDPSAFATRDGTWHIGEFALWKHSDFGRPIYDTTDDEISTYNGRYFVNTDQRLNDEASSTGNGFRDRAIRAYKHSGFDGPSVYHNRYPNCPTPTCFAYKGLGWASDELSSHVHAG